jgi:hypothetical protein
MEKLNQGNNDNGPKKFVFFIGKDKYETDKDTLTVGAILKDFAKVDPKVNTLALKEEGNVKEFTDPNELITMKNGMHFTIFNNEPTPVS